MKISRIEDAAVSSTSAPSGGGAVADVLPRADEVERSEGAGPRERIVLLALSMALVALGIDVLLPAFGDIRSEFGLAADSTAVAGLITAYFVGLAVGQLPSGLLADRYGRKPVLQASVALYVVGALVSAFAPSLVLLMVARFLWGLASSGPRVVAFAVVRDTFSGEDMSRAMSLMMAVFITVPVVAPALGAVGVGLVGWRGLFVACGLAGLVMLAWGRRLPETLTEDRRREIRFGPVRDALVTVVRTRQTLAHALALTALYGVFTSWIASSEIILGETFGVPELFPYLFGGLAAVLGVAMLTNSAIVQRVGTERLSRRVMVGYLVSAAALVVLALMTDGVPPLWLFMLFMAAMLSSHALLIPNFNSLAMEPMGDLAGTASALIGTFQIAVGALLGSVLDQAFDGTIRPLALGFLGYGLLAAGLLRWADAEPRDAGPADAAAGAEVGHGMAASTTRAVGDPA